MNTYGLERRRWKRGEPVGGIGWPVGNDPTGGGRLIGRDGDVVVEVVPGRDFEEDVVAVASGIDLETMHVKIREQAARRPRG